MAKPRTAKQKRALEAAVEASAKARRKNEQKQELKRKIAKQEPKGKGRAKAKAEVRSKRVGNAGQPKTVTGQMSAEGNLNKMKARQENAKKKKETPPEKKKTTPKPKPKTSPMASGQQGAKSTTTGLQHRPPVEEKGFFSSAAGALGSLGGSIADTAGNLAGQASDAFDASSDFSNSAFKSIQGSLSDAADYGSQALSDGQIAANKAINKVTGSKTSALKKRQNARR